MMFVVAAMDRSILCSCALVVGAESQVLGRGGQRQGSGGGQPSLRRDGTRVAALMQLDMADFVL